MDMAPADSDCAIPTPAASFVFTSSLYGKRDGHLTGSSKIPTLSNKSRKSHSIGDADLQTSWRKPRERRDYEPIVAARNTPNIDIQRLAGIVESDEEMLSDCVSASPCPSTSSSVRATGRADRVPQLLPQLLTAETVIVDAYALNHSDDFAGILPPMNLPAALSDELLDMLKIRLPPLHPHCRVGRACIRLWQLGGSAEAIYHCHGGPGENEVETDEILLA